MLCCAVLAHCLWHGFENPHLIPVLHTDTIGTNPGYTVGIKVHARAGVLLTAQGFLQPADLHGCSVRRESHIVEVGYRRGRRRSDERQKNRRIRLDSSVVHGLLWSLLFVESRGRVATVVGTIWWVSWVLFINLFIFAASGQQQNQPKFHSWLFIWLLIKNTVTPAAPQRSKLCMWVHKEDQGYISVTCKL